MAKRILLLSQWFDPEPTFKGLLFARELVSRGFDVEVVTGFPNYPGGKLYPGYRMRALQREVVDGVKITRVPLYPSHGQSGARRALNYLSFAIAAFAYTVFAQRPDVIYAYHPPLTVGVAAALVRLLRRVPVVYDIQDMWPDTLRATGMVSSARILAIVGKVCGWVYRRVDHLVVLSPGFKWLLVARGVSDHKIDVIYNWCSEAALAAPTGALPAGFPPADRFRILFAGNMGKAQALDSVLEAAAILRGRGGRVCFIFLGGGVEVARLREAAAQRGLDNVLFLDQVPMEEVGTILRAADALLVHLRKDPLFEVTIPSKTQAYMAVGKPILMAVNGDAAELVREGRCGVVAQSEDPHSIAAAAFALAEADESARTAMARSGRDFYSQHLSLNAGVTRFARIFARLSGASAEAA